MLTSLLFPEEFLEPLHPLEVRHDDPTGVREHVWDDADAGPLEDLVGFGGRRVVCALEDDFAQPGPHSPR